jgi:sensor histidine kinase YesM
MFTVCKRAIIYLILLLMKPLSDHFHILRVPAFWRFQLSFWTFVVLIQILLLGVMGGGPSAFLNPWIIVVRLIIGLILSSVAAVVLVWLNALHLSSVKFTMATGGLILILFTIGSLVGYNLFQKITHELPPKQILLAFLLVRVATYTLWVLLFLRFLAQSRRESLLRENNRSELSLLRAQVNPHFLFNSLNAIVAELEDPEKVREITFALSEYLRFSVKQGDGEGVDLRPLGEELMALKDYLRIHQIRFEEKLVSMIDVEEEARSQQVPQALIQPLLENAITYGQKTSPLPLVIRIMAQLSQEKLVIVVENSGHWIERTKSMGVSASTGTGLRNLRRRLELIYGKKASLEIEKTSDKVRVVVSLPVMVQEPPVPQP